MWKVGDTCRSSSFAKPRDLEGTAEATAFGQECAEAAAFTQTVVEYHPHVPGRGAVRSTQRLLRGV